jgi:hypothetical protein
MSSQITTALIIIVLSLSTDSLIAFKSALTLNFGVLLICVLNLIYKDGRPFWYEFSIKSNSFCLFDFGSPNQTLFILTFFYWYLLIMYRFKFAAVKTLFVNYVVVVLLVATTLVAYFSGLANGLNYVY